MVQKDERRIVINENPEKNHQGPGQALNLKSGAYVQIDILVYYATFKDFSIPETYRSMWDR